MGMKLCRFCDKDFENKEKLLIHVKESHIALGGGSQ